MEWMCLGLGAVGLVWLVLSILCDGDDGDSPAGDDECD
jgi:hypothetical protein